MKCCLPKQKLSDNQFYNMELMKTQETPSKNERLLMEND